MNLQGILESFGGVAIFFLLFLIVSWIVGFYLKIKVIQFVVVAVNLYKDIIQNQKLIIELLKLNIPNVQNRTVIEKKERKCPSCGTINESDSKFCEGCGMQLN